MDETPSTTVSAKQLRSFVERLQQLEKEKRAVAEQVKEVKAEANGAGFDVKTIVAIVALCKKDRDTLSEENSLLEAYVKALGLDHLLG